MFFSTSVLALIGSAALASAASVTFVTLDDVTRTIYFTANENAFSIDPVTVSNAQQTTVDFPDNYIGNFYAVKQGDPNVPGMLGEIMFGGYSGLTYFDVSAIVDPNDQDNVKQMWPASAQTPMSGCEAFPCNNAYYLPDDIQTKSTPETNLMCSLGSGSAGINFS